MVPAGRFLASLFAVRLPAGVEHHLMFSYRGRGRRPGAARDGTVTLASQLALPAQADAVLVRGFDEDHDSILRAPGVIAHLREALALVDASPRKLARDSLNEGTGAR